MIILNRKGPVNGGKHKIYTIDEAVDAGLEVVDPWRAVRAGEWCATDDGYVVQCIWTRLYWDKSHKGYVRFYGMSFGQTTEKVKELLFTKGVVSANNISNRPWEERFLMSERGQWFVFLYCKMMMAGKIDKDMLGRVARGDYNPRLQYKQIMRNKTIKKHLEGTMSEILKAKGIDSDSVLNDLIAVKTAAIKNGKYKDALEVITKFEKWTGLDELLTTGEIKGAREVDVNPLVASRMRELEKKEARMVDVPVRNGKQGMDLTDEQGNRLTQVPDMRKAQGE